MVRFIHTSDWQLGMTRAFMPPEAQARYAQTRLDAIRAMGKIARDENCAFMVVAGDVFESNQLGHGTVIRALEAMAETAVPVILLPGNHDPLDDGSIYSSLLFRDRKPDNVSVVTDFSPICPIEGVEVVGAPWTSKFPVGNPLLPLLDSLSPATGKVRICLAHGPVDILSPFGESEAVIPIDLVEKALHEGKVHYVALGDRHSRTQVGGSGRVWYSGTPEPTAFDEIDPGQANIVRFNHGVTVESRRIGGWSFRAMERELRSADEVAALLDALEALPDKDRSVVRLTLMGCLGLVDRDRLARGLEDFGLLFAGFDVRDDNLVPDPGDCGDLCRHLSGYAGEAAEMLRAAAASDTPDGQAARDALLLLSRLAPAPTETDA